MERTLKALAQAQDQTELFMAIIQPPQINSNELTQRLSAPENLLLFSTEVTVIAERNWIGSRELSTIRKLYLSSDQDASKETSSSEIAEPDLFS